MNRFVLFVLLLVVGPVYGLDTINQNYPLPSATTIIPKPFTKQSGLRFELHSVAPKTAGYRPIECTIHAKRVKSVNRQVTVQLSLTSWQNNNRPLITVEQSGELPSGASSTQLLLRVPQSSDWNYFGVKVYVDGKLDNDLSYNYFNTNSTWSNSGVVPELQVLRLNVKQSALKGWNLGKIATQALQAIQQQQAGATANVTQYSELMGLAVEESDGAWQSSPLDYSTYDVVILNHLQLELIAKEHPAELDNLLRWVATGGMLWIEGAGNRPSVMAPQIDEFLNLKRWGVIPVVESMPLLNEHPEWTSFRSRRRDGQFDPALETEPPSRGDSRDWLLKRQLGFGEVYAFQNDYKRIKSGGRQGGRGVGQTVENWRSRAWAPRHGLNPDAANSEYSTFLIPGVGLAPVLEFEVLITLFVLVIGPLNYLLLKSYDRLHLMVLTTPLCALLASAGLFGYAVIADGFGAKARLRSVTLLDQRSGEMVNAGRCSLYAGLTPSEGLSIPADTAIYAILPGWNENSVAGVRQPPRELVWTDTAQKLTSGWLPSRTTSQYYTLRANTSERQLRIAAAAAKVKVTNELGANITWLVVIDDAHQIWIGKPLAAGDSQQLSPIKRLEAAQQLRELCLAADPQFPEGYDGDLAVNNNRNRRYYGNRAGMPIDYANVAAGTSLMEITLDELNGLTGGEALSLPPRSYVALTTTATEQPVLLKDCDQIQGFHVTIGRW